MNHLIVKMVNACITEAKIRSVNAFFCPQLTLNFLS